MCRRKSPVGVCGYRGSRQRIIGRDWGKMQVVAVLVLDARVNAMEGAWELGPRPTATFTFARLRQGRTGTSAIRGCRSQ